MTEVENIVFVVGYGNDIKWFGMPLIKKQNQFPLMVLIENQFLQNMQMVQGNLR